MRFSQGMKGFCSEVSGPNGNYSPSNMMSFPWKQGQLCQAPSSSKSDATLVLLKYEARGLIPEPRSLLPLT